MTRRLVTVVDDETHLRCKTKADLLGLTLSQYLKTLVDENLRFNKIQDNQLVNKTYGELKSLATESPHESVRTEAILLLRRYLT